MAALLPLLLVDESNKDCTWDWAAVYKHLDNTSKTVAFSLARLPSALRSKEGLGSVRDAAHVLEVALADAKWADQQEPEPEAVEQPEVVAGADPASMDQEALPQAPAHAPPSSAGGGEEAAAAEATAGPQAGAPPTAQQLGQMPYKEVQQLAKELGLKASGCVLGGACLPPLQVPLPCWGHHCVGQ